MYPIVVEPEFLHLLDDPSLLIVDIRPRSSYEKGHIEGSFCVPPSLLVSGERPATGKLPSSEHLEKVLSEIGYDPERYVVAYDDEGGGWAGRFVWTLHVIGHKNTSIVNGGLVSWYNDGLPLTRQEPYSKPVSVNLTIDPSARVTRDELLNVLQQPPSVREKTVIWDARSADEFHGRRLTALKAGHIPGAVNLDWQDLMDRNRGLRLREDLETLLHSKGIMAGKQIVTHCQSHHRSGLTYVAGRHLGLDIRAYDGSWSEWGNDAHTPVET